MFYIFLALCQAKNKDFKTCWISQNTQCLLGLLCLGLFFLSLSIWSSYFTFPSLAHPFFIGLDMIYLRWYSRRVIQRKYFQINCSLEALISYYFHRFNSMAVCTSIVCALFWTLQWKKLYFSNRRNSLHPPKHLLQKRLSLCAICDLVNAEPLKAAKVRTVSKNL